jgi:hypothetical protein
MVYFQTQNPNLGKFWSVLDVAIFYVHFEYFIDIWDILRPFGTFCGHWVLFHFFGIMYQEKSGNPPRVFDYEPLEFWHQTVHNYLRVTRKIINNDND